MGDNDDIIDDGSSPLPKMWPRLRGSFAVNKGFHLEAHAVVKHGWPIVDSIRGCDELARPVAGHPRRCQAKLKLVEEQCPDWAIEEQIFCKKHVSTQFDMGAYDKLYSPDMLQAIAEQREAAPHERLSVSDELDLMRVLAGEAITLFNKAKNLPESTKGKDMMVLLATEQLKTVVQQVTQVTLTAAKVHAFAEDHFSLEQMSWVLAAVARVLDKHLQGQDPNLIKAISEDMKAIRLPPKTSSKTGGAQEAAKQLREATMEMDKPFG